MTTIKLDEIKLDEIKQRAERAAALAHSIMAGGDQFGPLEDETLAHVELVKATPPLAADVQALLAERAQLLSEQAGEWADMPLAKLVIILGLMRQRMKAIHDEINSRDDEMAMGAPLYYVEK